MKSKFFSIAAMMVLFFSFMLTCLGSMAQKNIFIRLYDVNGRKIGKGNLMPGTDSTIQVLHGKQTNMFSISRVGEIKTRRTFGHSVLIGTGVGVGLGTIGLVVAIIGDNSDNINGGEASFDIAVSSFAAPYAGALVGAVVAALTKRETFEINGDAGKWKTVKSGLLPDK